MFDAKSLLEAMMRGSSPGAAPQQAQGGGGLADILAQIAQAANQPATASGAGQAASGGGLGGLGDILGQLGKAMGQPAPAQAPAAAPQMPGAAGGGLGDILSQLQKQLGAAGGGGGLADILGQVLGNATTGVREGAKRIDEATGIGGHTRDAITQASGLTPEQILAQLQDLAQRNQLGTGAALGGLGAVVLGTRSGRALAGTAAKLGALALIGGLAYKAYLDYTQGKPADTPKTALVGPAPAGSGFEPEATSHETAVLCLRAMIAAAAADGRIDEKEQARVLGGIKEGGLGVEAQAFLQNEIANPATADDLASQITDGHQAVQVYSAARLAVDLHAEEEAEFLSDLATKLGLDQGLVDHIEAAARANV